MIIILLVQGIVFSARIVKFVVESVADDRECLEWYGTDRDFDPEWHSSEECREIGEAFNS